MAEAQNENDEGDSSSLEDSDRPFTTSSEIKRRLGPLLTQGL